MKCVTQKIQAKMRKRKEKEGITDIRAENNRVWVENAELNTSRVDL